MIDAHSYNITVRKAIIDGETFFEATVRELPDLAEYGDSHQEAYELAIDAIETAAKMYADAGRAFPPAHVPEDRYSGRITLRMPKSLHKRLAVQAEQDDISLNQYILGLLAFNAGHEAARSNHTVTVSDLQRIPASNATAGKGKARNGATRNHR